MTIALSGRNKLGFVDGSLSGPTSNSSARVWDRVDNIVMGCIIGVLEDSIANSILSFKTSKEIWDELEERYGQSSNVQMFSLQEELNALVQTLEMSISEFFTKIKTLWDEFDALNPIPSCSCTAAASCTCDVAKKVFKMQQNNKVFSFLM
jgi:LTR polyprotein gag-polypeptide-like protein